MNYQIEIAKKVRNFLKRQPRWLRDQFERQVELLAENPFRRDLDSRKMRGSQSDYRLRIGKYRFLYTIMEDRLLIYMYKADVRCDVY